MPCFAQGNAAEVMLCDFQASALGGPAASMFVLSDTSHYLKKLRLDYQRIKGHGERQRGTTQRETQDPPANSKHQDPSRVNKAILDFPA